VDRIVEQVITAQEVEITGDLLLPESEFLLSREVERGSAVGV